MAIEVLHVLFTGLHFAVLGALYGWLVAIPWSPFLLVGRFRRLFDSLPPADWRVSYALWMALPAMVWAFFFGSVLSLSRDVRPPTEASEIYVAGVDGLVVATAISISLWPILLLYVLPARGFDWIADERTPATGALVVGSTIWYLLWLVVPVSVFVFFAAWGGVVSGP